MGFSLESEKDTDSFSAFNEDGYSLELRYSDYNSEISIRLDVPKKYGNISWPSIGIAAQLPEPASKMGIINADASNEFMAEISETSEEEYNSYIDKCIEKGFAVDYSKGKNLFEAYNEKGDLLTVRYKGFNVMSVSILAKGDEESSKETQAQTEIKSEATEKAEEKQNDDKNNSDSVSADFKAAMDSYEKFFDEYISFMEKYSESDNPLDMLDDYNDYLKKYTETIGEFYAVDVNELSESDYSYYIEVQSRIYEKLSESGY